MNASTTGNIYGVYDMSGGAWEYVDALYGTVTDIGFWSDYYSTEEDYKELGLQHGLVETKGWYGGTYDFVNETTPHLIRGGSYSDENSNIFSYSSIESGIHINISQRHSFKFYKHQAN